VTGFTHPAAGLIWLPVAGGVEKRTMPPLKSTVIRWSFAGTALSMIGVSVAMGLVRSGPVPVPFDG